MINRAKIQGLLKPMLNAIIGEPTEYPVQWKEWFEIHQSKMAAEMDTELAFLPEAEYIPEGTPVMMRDMGQRSTTVYTHRKVGIGFQITEEALEDNLYKNQFPMTAKALRASLRAMQEKIGASIFNNGFSTDYKLADGQPLFSPNHPIDGGVVANTPTVQMDLNEASLEAAIIGIQKFRSQSGLKENVLAEKLLVSRENQFVAEKLLNSVFMPGVANNDINPINSMKAIPKGYRVNQYIDLPNFWGVSTNAKNTFKFFNRRPYQTDVYTDFATGNMVAKATERYSFGVSSFMGMWASSGA
jgi:hypothetical protein